MSWTVVKRKSVFQERTIYFNKQEMDEIRKTCTNENVSSLTNGRWETNDPKSRKDHIHTLDLARAGELAVYTVLCAVLSVSHPEWVIGRPNFARRENGQYDYGDIPIDTGTERRWVEVKTTTNRKGAHNKKNVNRVAREYGYTFQKLIWNKWKKKMVPTPTFNPRSPYHKRANSKLLVGCVGTYLKNGGAMITVSQGTFMLPVGQCKWKRLNRYAKGEEELKMVHHDPQCIP